MRGILLAYLGYGVWSLVYMQLIQSFLFTIQHWFFSGWAPSFIIDKKKLLHHFQFGYKLTIAGIVNAIFDNAYNIIIGKFFTVTELGFYNRANTLQMFPAQNLSVALSKVTYPMFAAIQEDDLKLKIAYKKFMQQVMFWVVPVMLFAAILARPLFILLLTEKWAPAVPYFQILCVVGILYPMQDYNLNILRVKGRSDLILKINIIKRITFIIGIALVISYGIIPLLIVQAVNSVFSYLYNSYYSGKFINYSTWSQVKDVSPVFFLGSISGIIVWSGNWFLFSHLHNIFQLIIGFAIGFGTYIFCSYLFKFDALTEFNNLVVNDIKRRLKRTLSLN